MIILSKRWRLSAWVEAAQKVSPFQRFSRKPRLSCMATEPHHLSGISAPNFQLMLPSHFCFLFSDTSHLTPWFSSHSSPILTSPFIFWGIKRSFDVSRVSIVHLPSLAAFSRLSFLILQLHTRAHTRARACVRVEKRLTYLPAHHPAHVQVCFPW